MKLRRQPIHWFLQLIGCHTWLGLIMLLVMCGCEQPLFVKKNPRTQFEQYDVARNIYVPLEQSDVFGRPRPALRARLLRE